MTETAAAPHLQTADIARIMKLLPHRYPFLLIDRMYDMNGEESGVAVKNVTMNEPFFQGHFPGRPVMPGVLLIEAMAQTAGALVLNHLGDEHAGKLVFFMSIEKARFRKPVAPGDSVHIHVKLTHKRPPVWKYWAEAMVEGKKAAEAEIGAMLMNERGA
ncbi:MAG: 3-hydroxyacyl-ACP dehydratase FabZ [Aestuariivirga sp.]|uniref:3-hydroxyacyl-ACP dehydratase FabZ n=1 Tax=Aestuariivirga sp. TaxID=2650926 RepID=UPI0025C191B3|nr:3-hydroxyacyl-ACP dehydratase FabZ [Aestuariivirga sp.]MCA3562567.1 3-hydroxyacyl-ACP dehydratase FabZ [Aestuariivirga sp.]